MIGSRSSIKEANDVREPATVESHSLKNESFEEIKKQLHYREDGLSNAEAEKRLTQYGYNELQEEESNPFLQFLSYFWGPIPWMIEIAAILSLVVRHWADFCIILVLLLVNAIVGFWEEFKAGNTIAALKEKLALNARVKRGGHWISLSARELVPGDVIRLRNGDITPADSRLLDGDPIQVDQSALTGESLPVECKTTDPVYSGSIVKQGEISALVYATGLNTYFGQTAHLMESEQKSSHFQKAILKIGDFLILLAVVLVAVILAVALFRGDDLFVTLQFALVLTVAAIPVAMPTVLSVTMAVGARMLTAKQAIVTRLSAIEELAGINILCSDKTGTLTQNQLTLDDPFPMNEGGGEELIRCAALASREENQDPIDMAVLGKVRDKQRLDSYTVERFVPFDSTHKRTEASVRDGENREFKVSKGAPQVILDLCSNSNGIVDRVNEKVNEYALRGYRTLGVARTDDRNQWEFLGVLPLYDPPREDSKSTIEEAKKKGVDVKMITGDQLAIAKETAKQLGMRANILDASIFEEARCHQAGQCGDEIEKSDGFAQVFPEHKYHIVDSLQKSGNIVGMTGDGVNDAPALKKADVGIAVSGATDAARSASDIVLLSEGISVIVDAIKESRRIFQRMNSYAIYRITETIRILLFMTLSILIFDFYPVTAVMIVMLALLNDGAILSIAYDRAKGSDRPDTWNMPVVLGVSTLLGVFGVVETFGLFYLGERVFHMNRELLQTLIYLKLSVSGHLTIFVTRTRKHFWSMLPSPLLLGAVVGTQFVATLIAVYGVFMTPLGWSMALLVWGYCLIFFVLEDQANLLAHHIFDCQKEGLLTQKRMKCH